MEELHLVPTGFTLCWIAYYLRGIIRLHRTLRPSARGNTFWETWLRFWLSPAILKDAFRCAMISFSVFLGIEIARGHNVEREVDEDSEIDHF